MTVEEARKILGNKIKNLNDSEVLDLIRSTAIVCEELINMYLNKNKIKEIIN